MIVLLKAFYINQKIFDPHKRYPLIIFYYEKLTQGLNVFQQPRFTGGGLNIPWFVSRGYLVFTPDIYYTIGKTAQSIVTSVVTSSKQIAKMPFIDINRMGIMGHSFGGYETNVLITSTKKLFAAAAEGAGASNFLGSRGVLLPSIEPQRSSTHVDGQNFGQYRIAVTPWENLDPYISNSPIYKSQQVSTPLLIMHNKKDASVGWEQGVEFFLALRRFNKKVWMLQYDNGGHGIERTKDKNDYTIRLTQFYDHYLKSAPAPIWMTQGIPARLKQIETGYTYDPSGNCGKDCKVCKTWNEKMKKDSAGTWKEIEKRKAEEHWQ